MPKKEKLRIKLVAKPDDIKDDIKNTLDEMDRELFADSPLAKKEESWWWLVIDQDKNVVAFAGLTVYSANKTGFLSRVGVRKSHRGQGLQKKLIKVREKMLKKLGYSRMITYVAYDNIHSANNLINCGYRLYIPRWEWGLKWAFYLEKYL